MEDTMLLVNILGQRFYGLLGSQLLNFDVAVMVLSDVFLESHKYHMVLKPTFSCTATLLTCSMCIVPHTHGHQVRGESRGPFTFRV